MIPQNAFYFQKALNALILVGPLLERAANLQLFTANPSEYLLEREDNVKEDNQMATYHPTTNHYTCYKWRDTRTASEFRFVDTALILQWPPKTD